MAFIDRKAYQQQIQDSLARFRVTALLGPRQCGKTTLARSLATGSQSYFDLEDPVDLARLEAPRQTLGKLTGLVVIDEIQRRPDLFPLLRVLADRPGTPARFLILGSASPDLVKGVSESLAGRVGFVDLSGFDGTEVGFERLDTLWLRGGFPESFLSASDEASFHWRQQFIRTFLTRDIPQLGITIPAEQLRRFWLMIAHYHGQTWNASEIAGSLGINYKTAQHYLDILTGAFMIRSLPSWTENLGKRVRKAPKIYLRDSGLFHSLQNIRSMPELQAHPKLGASWEGLALDHVLRVLRAEPGEAFYWAHPRRRGIGFDACSRRPALGIRVQIWRRAARHQVHARGAGRFETATPLCHLSGREGLALDERHRSAGVTRLRELAGSLQHPSMKR